MSLHTRSRRSKPSIQFGCFCMYLSVVLTGALVLFIVGQVLIRGIPNLSWQLLSTAPSYLNHSVGILPDILNTLYLICTTMLLVLPLGVGAAIYLNEYATHPRLVAVIETAAETLSGIPSILYGLVGMLLFLQVFQLPTSLLAGSLTLTIMNLPTILRTTQESLKTIPISYREGALGLGATQWRVIRTVVLPNCIDGIVTGCILSMGRILGESAALLFTAGFGHALNGYWSAMGQSGATLTVSLYIYAKENGEFQIAFAIAALLMGLTICLNLSASWVGTFFQKRRYQ